MPGNTTEAVLEGPHNLLSQAMAIGCDKVIINQESQGQISFVGSDTLPAKFSFGERQILEAAGIKFLGIAEDDKQFQYVELPAGWKKEATDHPMWSNLVDEKGRIRARIFYKAAFYDRNSFIQLVTRFCVWYDFKREDTEKVAVGLVMDCDKVIFATTPIQQDGSKNYEAYNKAKEAAGKWLDENYPDWKNPGAYWD